MNPINCPWCGYDVQSLLAEGRRRCPECGKNVPRGWFVHIEPQAPSWYLALIALATLPAIGSIAVGLTFPGIVLAIPFNPGILAAWILLAELYLYMLAYAFCKAHRLPRVAFGAFPVSMLALLPNIVTAGTFFGVWR
jgi:hypothetical protein